MCYVIFFLLKLILYNWYQKKYRSETVIEVKGSVLVPLSKVFLLIPIPSCHSMTGWEGNAASCFHSLTRSQFPHPVQRRFESTVILNFENITQWGCYICVCGILLSSLLSCLAGEDLESSSDPQSSPDDGRLDRHLDQDMNREIQTVDFFEQ